MTVDYASLHLRLIKGHPLRGFVSVAFMFSIDMNALRAIASIEAALFPRQGIHINRKRDASPNRIVRRTFTRGDLSKGEYIFLRHREG